MKHAYTKAMAMALALFALSGCENMKRDQASAMDTSTTYSSTGGGAGAMASSSGDMSMMNAVVVNIEPMSRSSAMAGSSQGGTTGSATTGSPDDMVHKVTVRMDDGSTRTIVQDMAPTFKSGDRVHVMNNMIHMK